MIFEQDGKIFRRKHWFEPTDIDGQKQLKTRTVELKAKKSLKKACLELIETNKKLEEEKKRIKELYEKRLKIKKELAKSFVNILGKDINGFLEEQKSELIEITTTSDEIKKYAKPEVCRTEFNVEWKND